MCELTNQSSLIMFNLSIKIEQLFLAALHVLVVIPAPTALHNPNSDELGVSG